MDHEIELILKELEGTNILNKKELLGFNINAIAKLIIDGKIIRTKDRSKGGTLAKYYLSGK